MTHALVLLMALLIGIVAGLRSLTAPAVVAWAAFLGWINMHNTWASWVGNIITVIVLTVLAVGELVNDKLPKTPARTAAPIFAARIITGGFAGAVLGTLGGYQARKRLVAARNGQDLPVALLEDAVAILGGFAILAVTASL